MTSDQFLKFAELQQTMSVFNREMANDGAFPLAVYEEMLAHIAEYRNGDGAAASAGN